MRVIVDRIEGEIILAEAGETIYKLPHALCTEAKEGDTIEITVVGKISAKEEPHAIFERLRKNSRRTDSSAEKSRRKDALPSAESDAIAGSENADNNADS